jgi:hypothetical protein
MAKTVGRKSKKKEKRNNYKTKKNYKAKKGGFNVASFDTSKVHPASIILSK